MLNQKPSPTNLPKPKKRDLLPQADPLSRCYETKFKTH